MARADLELIRYCLCRVVIAFKWQGLTAAGPAFAYAETGRFG